MCLQSFYSQSFFPQVILKDFFLTLCCLTMSLWYIWDFVFSQAGNLCSFHLSHKIILILEIILTNLLNTASYFLVSPGTIRNNLNFLNVSFIFKGEIIFVESYQCRYPTYQELPTKIILCFSLQGPVFVSFSTLLFWLRTPDGNGSVDSVYVWLGAHLGFCVLKDRQLASLLCLQSGG